MANPGAESFFGGLLQGVGQGIMNSEQMQYEKKMRDAQSRQRIFETIANDPTMGWDDKATALEQSISGLLPRDKKGNLIPNPASDAIQKIVDSYRQMGAAARTGAQTGAVPATGGQTTSQAQNPIAPPQQSPAIVAPANGSVPALPSMPELQPQPAPPAPAPTQAQAPSTVSSLPSIPPLRFNPPRTPAEARSQQEALTQYQMRMGELQTRSALDTQAFANQQALQRKLASDIGLKEGTPEFTNFMAGRNIVATRPASLDQAAADLFNKYRAGEISKEQFDSGVESLRSMKSAMEKPPAPTDIRQYTADYLAANGLPDNAQNRLKAHAAFTKETKTDPGAIRASIFVGGKDIGVIDKKTGDMVMASQNDINNNPGRYAPAAQGTGAMGKEAVFQDIDFNIKNTRDAIRNLKSPFDATTRAQLALALRAPDPQSSIHEFLTGTYAKTLTPDQIDYTTALASLMENAMALRGVAGMGQGSDDLRQAILRAIPGPGTPSAAYANRQLDLFQGTVNRLHTGVPGVMENQGAGLGEVPKLKTKGAATFSVTDPRGTVHTFPTQQAADAFKAAAGIK